MAGRMASAGLLGLLSLAAQPAAANKVIKMPMSQKRNSPLLVKREPFLIAMQNYIPFGEYFVTASVGTPAQEIELIVDTGSSDVWMFGTGSCTQGPCEGGSFDKDASRTLVSPADGEGAFLIQYQTPGSIVRGDYIEDTFSVGGVQVTNFTMAVATKAAQVPSGIMGIGLAVNEAGASQLGTYPNYPDVLVSQNKISSKAYSLYLDDLSTASGTILFGGYDEAKFAGELKMLPIQLDDQSNAYTSFTVAWTTLGVQNSDGEFAFASKKFVYGAVLDTGTTLTYLPTELYSTLADYFGAQTQDGITFVDCDFGKRNPGQLVFGFGGEDGPEIQVEFDELAIPLYSQYTGEVATDNSGTPYCQFGLGDAGDGFSILFGQSFLRSAYVLYDLDNLQLGIAQTIFDSTDSNIIEYKGDGSSDRIESVTAGPTVTYGAVATDAPGGGGIYSSFFFSGGGGDSFSTGNLFSEQASLYSTDFALSSVAYPSNALPTAFPTTIPEGPTTRLTALPSDTAAANANNGGGGSGSGSGTGNSAAGLMTPAFATAGVIMLGLFTAMLML